MIRLLFWTVWFVLAATSAAQAGPVIGAIGAIFSAIGSLGALGQLILGVALNVGVSLLKRALQKDQEQQQPGVKGQLQVGGDLPLSFIVGTYATAGSLEYVNTWGNVDKTPNAFLTMVISLCDLPVTSLSSTVWVNGEKCTIDFGATPTAQGYPVLEYRVEGQDYLWVKFYDGTQTVADTFLTSKFSADPDRPWSSDMIGRGVAYAIVTARVNREVFTGVPQVKFVVNGIKLYDIRLDSTAGGSGPQRWNNPATWAFSNNPKVIAYNVIRGILYNGVWLYGGQNMAAARLPASSWMAAMNECDVLVSVAGGGTEKQFIAGAEIDVDQEPLGIVEELDKSCNGRTAEIGGFYKTHVGAPPLPVYAFTDEDIVITRGQSYAPFPGLEATYNGIHALYPEPDEAWAEKDAPPRYNATYETSDDNRRLIADASFPMVPNGRQVQQLMLSMINDARRFRQHNFFLPPEAWLLEPVVDAVSWTSSRNGYVAKLFTIGSMLDHPNCLQEVALKEVDPSDYNWSSADQLPSSTGFLGPIRPAPQLMTGWQVQPATIFDAAGNARRPSIEVFYDGDLEDVRDVRVQVRLAATGAGIYDGELPYGDPATNDDPESVVLNGTFLPATNYEVRGKFLPFSGRVTEWSFWLPVLTPKVLLGPDDIYPIDLDQLGEDVQNLTDWIGSSLREVQDELERIGQLGSDQDSFNFRDKQTLRTEIVSTAEGITASYTLAITVATNQLNGDILAVSNRVETLEVEVNDLETGLQLNGQAISALDTRVTQAEGAITVNSSAITSLNSRVTTAEGDIAGNATAIGSLTTRVTAAEGDITANSTAITALESSVNDVSASALFRAETFASPGGGWSRIGLQTRVNTSLGYASASIFLDAKSDGTSRIVLDAQELFFGDLTSGSVINPLVYSGGVWAMNVANIGTVNAGTIQGFDGKMIISLNNSNIIMSD